MIFNLDEIEKTQKQAIKQKQKSKIKSAHCMKKKKIFFRDS